MDKIASLVLYVYTTDIARDLTPEFSNVQSWARQRSLPYPNEEIVRLDPTATRELAVMFNCDFATLSRYFYRFSDRNHDPGRDVPLNRNPAGRGNARRRVRPGEARHVDQTR